MVGDFIKFPTGWLSHPKLSSSEKILLLAMKYLSFKSHGLKFTATNQDIGTLSGLSKRQIIVSMKIIVGLKLISRQKQSYHKNFYSF
jgi:hypothetical protein